MSIYENQIMNSDLDAFRNSGEIKTATLSVSGNLAAGSTGIFSDTIEVEGLDLFEMLFDSSTKHSGKFKNVKSERYTLVEETTNNSELTMLLEISVAGDVITVSGRFFNPYPDTVTLQTTTLNFRCIPYEGMF